MCCSSIIFAYPATANVFLSFRELIWFPYIVSSHLVTNLYVLHISSMFVYTLVYVTNICMYTSLSLYDVCFKLHDCHWYSHHVYFFCVFCIIVAATVNLFPFSRLLIIASHRFWYVMAYIIKFRVCVYRYVCTSHDVCLIYVFLCVCIIELCSVLFFKIFVYFCKSLKYRLKITNVWSLNLPDPILLVVCKK